MFDSVLIANRGEIACRITHTLRRLGIRSIAVFSEADRHARHVALADEARPIGPAAAADSYLRIDRVLEAARASGAGAIHPGYGFLSESAAFARAVADAGIVFVGPPVEAIEIMGAKDRAKAVVGAAGVPLVPGEAPEDQDPATLRAAAGRIGLPLLIKAAAGGGGRGMRVVRELGDFDAALESAKREARAGFGDERMLLERYLDRPRHVEVQVFGDRHGRVLHLFERDCSLQRRHQKVIEEAPAPGLGPELRTTLGAAAVRAAAAVGYTGAGTVEFLLDADGGFHFIEMNTRLQVEHPVTEMITGIDLVEWQLRVAAGEALPLDQDEVGFIGHSIEARLYAEDPAQGFIPSTGRLVHLRLPEAAVELRVETGVGAGDEVTSFYDPMIAKLVAWGPERDTARRRLVRALRELEVAPVATNRDFLAAVLEHPDVMAGRVDIGLLGELQAMPRGGPSGGLPEEGPTLAVLVLLVEREQAVRRQGCPHDPWSRSDGWRLNDVGHQTLRLRTTDGESHAIDAVRTGPGRWRLVARGAEHDVRASADAEAGVLDVEMGGRRGRLSGRRIGDVLHLFFQGRHHRVAEVDPLAEAAGREEDEALFVAPMPGRITRCPVDPGAEVAAGTVLIVLEAMKMEHALRAPVAGRLGVLRVREGEQVEEGTVLLDFEAGPSD